MILGCHQFALFVICTFNNFTYVAVCEHEIVCVPEHVICMCLGIFVCVCAHAFVFAGYVYMYMQYMPVCGQVHDRLLQWLLKQ